MRKILGRQEVEPLAYDVDRHLNEILAWARGELLAD